jgi:hypothetical protein
MMYGSGVARHAAGVVCGYVTASSTGAASSAQELLVARGARVGVGPCGQ